MLDQNKYWQDYKKEFSKSWHFNTFSTQKDYQYIGNLKTSYTQIDKLVESLDNLSEPEYAIEDNPKFSNKKILEKINSYKSW